jgi:hypothetical protein
MIVVTLVGAMSAPARACPNPVKRAIEKAFPKTSIAACRAVERAYEVKLAGRAIEVDVTPDGQNLLIEEKIPVDQVPPVVMSAFAARYPNAKVVGAERQTAPKGGLTYELAFAVGSRRREATFTDAGKFVGEE